MISIVLYSYYHVSSNAAARAWLLSGQALRLAIVSFAFQGLFI